MDILTLRGVPRALAHDGWWLMSETTAETGGSVEPPASRHWIDRLPRRLILVLLALIVVADVLFYRQNAGVSLALYAWAVLSGFLALGQARRDWKLPVLISVLGAVPVIEHVQLLSVAFLLGGLISALALLRWPLGTAMHTLIGQALRLFLKLMAAPFAIFIAAIRAMARLGRVDAGLIARPDRSAVRMVIRNWALPVGGGLILLSLMIEANPVLELRLNQIIAWDLSSEMTVRMVFWTGIALFVWPLLTAQPKSLAIPGPKAVRLNLGVNSGSVLRALWVFNALLGVQTLMDLSILVGRGSLPEGMSYAEYAHRGAYPLVLTAMLAGVFALMARPFAREHRALMPLLMLWLAQNVALCASSALRLELYVEAYGLTYLRLHAMIWMALVAAGLGLIGWQIVRGRDNGWLRGRLVMLGLATLYGASLVNFAEIVARQQLSREVASVEHLDISYVCGLGPMAHDAVALARAENAEIDHEISYRHCPAERVPHIDGWRDWTFRAWRVAR
ncbi:DUF4173 domain-containing protein [Primorskyibacter sp. 2E107]|uniref:DUF4153 domain-containing protein n=1 Tax=Primorskyibacter sp. 2E107 TaxID=3403458 RepID=UPI003AF6A153